MDVNATSTDHSSIKEKISDIIKTAILKEIELYLDSASTRQEYVEKSVQIEQLSLDIQLASLNESRFHIAHQVEKQMENVLSQLKLSDSLNQSPPHDQEALSTSANAMQSTESGATIVNSWQKKAKTLLYFLEEGKLPWWVVDSNQMSSIVNDEQLIELVSDKREFIQNLRTTLQKEQALKRLIQQFSSEALLHVFFRLVNGGANQLARTVNTYFRSSFPIIDQLSRKERATFWNFLFKLQNIQRHEHWEQEIFAAIQRIFPNQKVNNTLENNPLSSTNAGYPIALTSIVVALLEFRPSHGDSLKKFIENYLISQLDLKSITSKSSELQTKNNSQAKIKKDELQENEQLDQVKDTKTTINHSKDKLGETDEPIEQLTESNNESSLEINDPATKSEKSTSKDESRHSKSESSEKKNESHSEANNNQSASETFSKDSSIDAQNGNKIDPDSAEKKNIDSHSQLTESKKTTEKVKETTKNEGETEIRLEQKGLDKKTDIEDKNIRDISSERIKSTDENKLSEESAQISKKDDQSLNEENEDKKEQLATDAIEQKNALKLEEQLRSIEDSLNTPYQVELAPFTKSFIAENAGMILLHPFLKALFTKLELLDVETQQIRDPELAAHVLHYAATGREQDFEYSMTFEKYLCGIAPDHVMERKITLSQEVKASVDLLLESVLSHWTALKSKSTALLRAEFLQRKAKVFIDGNPRVVFERKVIDIMLDRLPWNLSIIRLPWRTELLYVEW